MSDELPDGIAELSVAKFRSSGLLLEVNRRVLHPIGVALSVRVRDDGTAEFGPIWDNHVADSEGFYFDLDDEALAKIANVNAIETLRHHLRRKALGYVIQPVPSPRP